MVYVNIAPAFNYLLMEAEQLGNIFIQFYFPLGVKFIIIISKLVIISATRDHYQCGINSIYKWLVSKIFNLFDDKPPFLIFINILV